MISSGSISKSIIGFAVLGLFGVLAVSAAEPEHEHHHDSAPSTPSKVEVPMKHQTTPESGKAREAGYRGHEMMQSTTVLSDLAVQCQQARDGLIILDRATLARCDGS